jgi:hypothetical protein
MAAGDVVACHNGVRNQIGRFAANAGHAHTLLHACCHHGQTTPLAPTSAALPTSISRPGSMVPLLHLTSR